VDGRLTPEPVCGLRIQAPSVVSGRRLGPCFATTQPHGGGSSDRLPGPTAGRRI
jgi:hypothetical protein